jgi:nucleotide-binding universal stress UspA family protein
MKILLATDGSAHSIAAIEELARMPFPKGTKVRIVTAFENTPLITSAPAPMGGLAGGYEETSEIVKELSDNILNKASELLKKKNPELSISTAAIKGSPKHVILEEAEKLGADLIVVGSHGRGTIGRFLLGSVSQAVTIHAQCSVMVVRKKEDKKTAK